MKEGRTWTDQELDARFQEAADSQAIPAFQEEFWTEMEAMLPAKKNRKAIFWWGGSAAVVLIAGSFMFLMSPFDTAKVELGALTADLAGPTEKQISKQKQIIQKDVKENPESKNDLPLNLNLGNLIFPIGMDFNYFQPTCGVVIYDNGWPFFTMNAPNLVFGENNSDAVLTTKQLRFTETKTLSSVDRSKYNKSLPIYIEAGLGYGQSYRQAEYETNWMPQFRLGVGLYQEIGNMELSAGIAFRAELPENITFTTHDFIPPNIEQTNTIDIKRLYSLEFPLSISGKVGRSTIGGVMVPGIQLRYSGVQTTYQNTEMVSREEVSGDQFESKTMTMEVGAKYMYSLTENTQLTSSFTVDVLRPFQAAEYLGDIKQNPVTLFIGLRRTF